MKRANFLLDRIAEPDNLRLAFWKAQRGKSTKLAVEAYRRSLDANLKTLREELLSGEVSTGDYHYFTIYDPKERQICAAAFRERVLHHALMNVCHEYFETYQIYDSYACRLGKGTYAALGRAKEFQRKYRYFLKLDVRKYFDSINHDILKQLLQRRFKEPKLLAVFNAIIDSYSVERHSEVRSIEAIQPQRHCGLDPRHCGLDPQSPIQATCGLPIGNLTSQYFANHYLAYADRHLKEHLKSTAYVRYMDDMVLWENDKAKLLEIGKRYENFIREKLQLQLKPFCLNANDRGLPFLGYLLYASHTRLTANSRKRFAKKMENYAEKFAVGEWGQQEYQNHVLPLVAFTRHANTFVLRQKIINTNRASIEEGSNRVNRGGSWNNNASNCRVANRNNNTPSNRNNNLGFRLVLPELTYNIQEQQHSYYAGKPIYEPYPCFERGKNINNRKQC
ncbi:MAG: SUMF1/EgtB/PvdO family nonheme iron enzyme [Bacteroidales bacterium]|jgi:retron-type reverse transcriptase|nr:SUMF1/EgtB/PvdO family nonheme iron enzyme [Bacteroidales bacterium]